MSCRELRQALALAESVRLNAPELVGEVQQLLDGREAKKAAQAEAAWQEKEAAGGTAGEASAQGGGLLRCLLRCLPSALHRLASPPEVPHPTHMFNPLTCQAQRRREQQEAAVRAVCAAAALAAAQASQFAAQLPLPPPAKSCTSHPAHDFFSRHTVSGVQQEEPLAAHLHDPRQEPPQPPQPPRRC